MPQAVSLVVAISLLTAAPAMAASQPATVAARPGGSAPGPAIGTVHAVTRAAQQAARAFWTPARMARATLAQAREAQSRAAQASEAQGMAGQAGPPPGTPTATPFGGVPTIGALFYTTGSAAHFCTASVVDSEHEDLIVTAAHCVYASGYSDDIEFVPGYHDGRRPYGAWLVQAVVVARAWRQRHDPDLDFAFLTVALALYRQAEATAAQQ